MSLNGKIIVIEGTDGSGKQTQAKKLRERLLAEGYNVYSEEVTKDGKVVNVLKTFAGEVVCEYADVEIEVFLSSKKDSQEIRYIIEDKNGNII